VPPDAAGKSVAQLGLVARWSRCERGRRSRGRDFRLAGRTHRRRARQLARRPPRRVRALACPHFRRCLFFSKRTSASTGRRALSSPTMPSSWRKPHSAGSTMRPSDPLRLDEATICWMQPTAPRCAPCRARRARAAPLDRRAEVPELLGREVCGAGSVNLVEVMTTGSGADRRLAAGPILPGDDWARASRGRGHRASKSPRAGPTAGIGAGGASPTTAMAWRPKRGRDRG